MPLYIDGQNKKKEKKNLTASLNKCIWCSCNRWHKNDKLLEKVAWNDSTPEIDFVVHWWNQNPVESGGGIYTFMRVLVGA